MHESAQLAAIGGRQAYGDVPLIAHGNEDAHAHAHGNEDEDVHVHEARPLAPGQASPWPGQDSP